MNVNTPASPEPTGAERVLRAGAGFGLVAVAGGLLWPVAAAVIGADLWRSHRARTRAAG